ncbi:hypothetical protein AVEN_150332-1 [Araneus ventricosus]|uniref:Uncharacterized protein n=1 Tax=Araneus ventricosus TaxID=182803 RepID=A0A4Y2P8Y3_ARAVE|nr:hypothetical protein AVEN_150332-1 [Araneus ventricosus]
MEHPHTGAPTRFPRRNISGSVDWKGWTNTRPPCSPLITPLDFFLLGLFLFGAYFFFKDRVFATLIADVEELKARIQAAVCTVTEDLLKNIWRELEYRLDILRATKGAHVEIY